MLVGSVGREESLLIVILACPESDSGCIPLCSIYQNDTQIFPTTILGAFGLENLREREYYEPVICFISTYDK